MLFKYKPFSRLVKGYIGRADTFSFQTAKAQLGVHTAHYWFIVTSDTAGELPFVGKRQRDTALKRATVGQFPLSAR
jgi:hypothetical protein